MVISTPALYLLQFSLGDKVYKHTGILMWFFSSQKYSKRHQYLAILEKPYAESYVLTLSIWGETSSKVLVC